MRIDACILTPQGFVRGHLQLEQGRIAAIEGEPLDEASALASGAPLALPGFVDAHVHGGGGADTMQAGESLPTLARAHARHGTTSLLATTMTAPAAQIEAALAAAAPHCAQRPAGGAQVVGIHLEGPWINPQRLGAQPAHAAAATLQQIDAWMRLAPIRLVTLAPEMPGHLALIGPLRERGLRVQIGHSDGSYDDGVAALAAGAQGFTHLFNAMSPLHHRAPGIAGAALAHATHAEIIPDLLHVHPGAIRAALRAIPCLYCVSDSTAGAGMPDGTYRLGDQTVFQCRGGVRLADGTLAGSALTMDQALRNLVAIGLPLREASARVSTIAADYLGLADRGRLAIGQRADLVLLDGALALQRVLVEGIDIDLGAA